MYIDTLSLFGAVLWLEVLVTLGVVGVVYGVGVSGVIVCCVGVVWFGEGFSCECG